jgi:tryptophanyl-tRNA synthetase
LAKFCTSFQARRAEVTDAVLDLFMTPRPLLWRGAKADTVLPVLIDKLAEPCVMGADKTPGSKNQAKKEKKLQLAAEKKWQKARGKALADCSGAETMGLGASS